MLKNLTIGQVAFDPNGLVDYFSASVEKDRTTIPLMIYVIRADRKQISLHVESPETDAFKLPVKLYGRILRQVEAFDKEGKRSIKL